MFQSTILIGRLGRDPEMRYTPSGIPVASLRLAVSKSWIGEDGVKQEKVTWWQLSAWRKQAETIAQYVKSGDLLRVSVEDIEARSFTDRDGTARASLDAKIISFNFLPNGKKNESKNGNQEPSGWGGESNGNGHTVSEEDIPF